MTAKNQLLQKQIAELNLQKMKVITEFNRLSLIELDGKYYDIPHTCTLSKDNFDAIKKTFGLKERNQHVITIDEALSIYKLYQLIEIDEDIQKPAIKIIIKELKKIAANIKNSPENVESAFLGNNKFTLSELRDKTFKTRNGKWKLGEAIGVGRDSFAFEAKGISKINKNKVCIAKLIKSKPIELYASSLNVTDYTNNPIISSDTKQILINVEKEQIKLNNEFGIKSSPITYNGNIGGIMEEKVPGITLTKWLKERPSELDKIYILIKLAIKLNNLHRNNLVHGDINSDNIIIDSHEREISEVYLIDLGNSKIKGTPRIRNRVFDLNTTDVKFHKNGKNIKLTAQDSRDDDSFTEDILELKTLARVDLAIPEDIVARNLDQTIRDLVTKYSMIYTDSKNFEFSKEEIKFWQEVDKNQDQQLQHIKKLKNDAWKTTMPKQKNRANKIRSTAIITSIATSISICSLYFSKSAIAIGNNLTTTVVNAVVIFSALTFLIAASVYSSFHKNQINITSWRQEPYTKLHTRITKTINTDSFASQPPLEDESPAQPRNLAEDFQRACLDTTPTSSK